MTIRELNELDRGYFALAARLTGVQGKGAAARGVGATGVRRVLNGGRSVGLY